MSTSRDIVVAVYDAFGRGDVPAVLGMFDPAIEWNEAEHFLWPVAIRTVARMRS